MFAWIRRIKALLRIAPDIKRLIQLWKGNEEEGSIRKQAMKAAKEDPEVREFIKLLDDVVNNVGNIL